MVLARNILKARNLNSNYQIDKFTRKLELEKVQSSLICFLKASIN